VWCKASAVSQQFSPKSLQQEKNPAFEQDSSSIPANREVPNAIPCPRNEKSQTREAYGTP
ncbi:hypothetical protein P4K96_17975, partial [Bacillus cereus]|nr:hypothetical protein [Bacillus cereus]